MAAIAQLRRSMARRSKAASTGTCLPKILPADSNAPQNLVA